MICTFAEYPFSFRFIINLIFRVFKQIPEAREKIASDARLRGDDSNLMRRGTVFLDGIEAALKQAENPLMLQDFISQLTAGHRQRYNVDGYMMADALDALKSIIFPYLKVKHGHRSSLMMSSSATAVAKPNDSNGKVGKYIGEENCNICITWERFFRHLRALLIATGAEN